MFPIGADAGMGGRLGEESSGYAAPAFWPGGRTSVPHPIALSAELGAAAVFDIAGGALLGQIVPDLTMNSTIYVAGFLGGPTPVPLTTVLVVMKNLTMRRFSNFETRT